MDLAKLRMVNVAASERQQLLNDIETGKFGVTINGKYQDDVIVELARGIVVGELRARVRCIEDDLRQYGVLITGSVDATRGRSSSTPIS